METRYKVLIITLIAIFVIALLTLPAKASELSDYKYLITHQDSPRNIQMLDDMTYEYGGTHALYTRMHAIETNNTQPRMNWDWKQDPDTGNKVYSGLWIN